MAPLPKSFDLRAITLGRLVRLGKPKRAEAKKLALTILAKGDAGPEVQRLAAGLFGGKRGRPATGAKHLWFEIGEMDSALRDRGANYKKRLEELKKEFRVNNERTIERALARYNAAMDEYRADIAEDF